MSNSDITRLLGSFDDDRESAVAALYPLVYDELRRLAQSALGSERSDHTLQATALVHEAYIKLVDQRRASFTDRTHFFAIAAQAIRRILVDHARHRGRQRRGGDWQRLEFEALLDLPAHAPRTDVLALEDALERLAELDPVKVQVVEMSFFAGLTHEEIATVLGVSTRTVERYWNFARAWLFRELTAPENGRE